MRGVPGPFETAESRAAETARTIERAPSFSADRRMMHRRWWLLLAETSHPVKAEWCRAMADAWQAPAQLTLF